MEHKLKTDPAIFCKLTEIFAVGGKLASVLADYRVRPEQVKLAERIQAALIQTKHCLAEAGTGIGKSLAYLIPGIDWSLQTRQRLLVSTHTKALQSQLVDSDLPRLLQSRLFNRPFRFALCLGADNYVCLRRLLQTGGQEALPGCDPEYVNGLHQLLDWCRQSVSGIRQDLPFSLPENLWPRVCVIKELCPAKACAYYDDCFWQLAKQSQWAADVLVTNHSLLFSHLAIQGRLLPEFGAAILDEAHKAEDVAAQFLSEETSQHEILRLLEDINERGRGSLWSQFHRHLSEPLEQIQRVAKNLHQQQAQWWQTLLLQFPPELDSWRIKNKPRLLSEELPEQMLQLSASLAQLAEAADSEESHQALQYCIRRLATAANAQKHWLQPGGLEAIHWAERSKRQPRPEACIRITPLDLSRRIQELVFSAIPAVVLTSATLALSGKFDYVRSRLGVTDAEEVIIASPFDYTRQVLLYLPRQIADPRQPAQFEIQVMHEALKLIRAFHGGVFVLCTSYRMLDQARAFFTEKIMGLEVLTQGEAPPAVLLRRFRENGSAVLLGVETFWQGVDVPGEALRCVVITRLPFDVPTHPLHQGRIEYLESQGAQPFEQYSLPRAGLMLKQGFGRLIRRQEDHGVVAILDPRIQTRAWGRHLLQALPDCQKTGDWLEVEKFIQETFNLPEQGGSDE